MRRVRLLVVAVMLAVAILATNAAPASAEWIQHPMTGNWIWCDYYGAEYWCNYQDVATGEWGWSRAAPGWQYGPLGG
jgi:hypothetical protein